MFTIEGKFVDENKCFYNCFINITLYINKNKAKANILCFYRKMLFFQNDLYIISEKYSKLKAKFTFH